MKVLHKIMHNFDFHIKTFIWKSLKKFWNVFENHLKKEFFKTTKFLVDDHKIVAQDYVQSSNFDSNIN